MVWFWNANGFDGAATDIVAFLKYEQPDVLVLIDSQLTDKESVKQCLGDEWKMIHESRPHNVHKRVQYGGITVLWRSKKTRVWRESGCSKGALSFIVQDVAGERSPVAVIALYSPPISSRLNRYGSRWSLDILDWSEMEAARLWQKYGFIIVGGDYNWRVHGAFRRRTEDRGSNASDASTRTELARKWHVRTSLRPLYGQRGQLPGVYTSRTANGMAEVDGISVCKTVPVGWTVDALKPPEWEEYSTRGGVHRPVGCMVIPPLLPASGARHSPREGDDCDNSGVAGTQADAGRGSQVNPLPYGSVEYHAMAPEIMRCCKQLAEQLQGGSTDLETGLPALAASLVEIQNRYYAQTRASPVSSSLGSGGTDAPAGSNTTDARNGTDASVGTHAPLQHRRRLRHNESGNAATGSRAMHRLGLRRRNPTAIHRRWAGMKVPHAVKALLKQRRVLVKKALAAKARQRREKPPTSKATADLEQIITDSLARAKTIRAEAVAAVRKFQVTSQNAEAQRLAHLIRHNPNKFFRELNEKKLPQPFETYDESTGPTPELGRTFRDFFARLLQRVAGHPENVGDEFRNSIPTTDPRTAAMLLAQISWQEVYAVLYPVHKEAVRRDPCLPDCKLCRMFSEHVATVEPGDTNSGQPEHRPRLWTSKAAGTDGVFAETLRWACPEGLGERHSYRREVCTALATIFTKIIDNGSVPMCPQFANATMTALYKGVGERDQPTNYRGICVPNVFAKLFGLVLGTRLSHWAVHNGVISPAQAGFVAMHGCEYHIFTLLETLRYRVRQNRDTVLVFLDFKKAYDSVPQALLWDVMRRMGMPEDFVTLLRTWSCQSNIELKMGGVPQEPFPQETGVPQGGVLSPICFNLFIEVLLRYINAHAARLGVTLSAGPQALQLLALAYADDVVLICHSMAAAQEALDLVQRWAAAFGMIIGIGEGKTQAMVIYANTVLEACANDVNGMPKKTVEPPATVELHPAPFDDPDDDSVILDDDDEPLEHEDPIVVTDLPVTSQPPLRRGQAWVNGRLCGVGTKRPLPYMPRPLPPVPEIPPLQITVGDVVTPIQFTCLYKYLGFMVRADLLDDHAYARVEKKTKSAAERLFPHHRLVRAWPVGLQLQLMQTMILSISAHVMPLLTSMRCPSESKTKRLDQLRKEVARSILRLDGSSRHAYVVSEACIGDVTGEIVMHRLRLLYALRNHPLRDMADPPIAHRMLAIIERESTLWHLRSRKTHMLLAPWTTVTARIVDKTVGVCDNAGWQHPQRWWENSPYASVVARVGERERWTRHMNQGIDWACHSFTVRPPSRGKQHTAALHWSTRLGSTDAGSIPKLAPLSCLGPHGSSVTAISRRQSARTFVLTSARQGNAAMQTFPFAAKTQSGSTVTGRKKSRGSRVAKPNAAAAAIAEAAENRRKTGKSCHLCVDSDDGPQYDLWHVLFECKATQDVSDVVSVRESCKALLPQLCDKIAEAVRNNARSISNTANAGVSHVAITDAIEAVRGDIQTYQWEGIPAKWLMYTLLLAVPFPAIAVRPDVARPVWRRPLSRNRKSEPDTRDMPLVLPVIPDVQYRLPELVGRLFDATILSRDSLRPLADAWCSVAQNCLLRLGKVVRPLRVAAERKRAMTAQIGSSAAAASDSADRRSSTSSSASSVSEP